MATNKSLLTENDANDITEIINRWNDNRDMYCVSCMYEAIRHWDRNMDAACTEDDAPDHPDRHDGSIFAHAGKDIWKLIMLLHKSNPGLIEIPLDMS